MSNVVGLGKEAVQIAARQYYTNLGNNSPYPESNNQSVADALWFSSLGPTPVDGGGCGGDCIGEGDGACLCGAVAILAVLVGSSVISSMAANDTRVLANRFKAKQKEAERLIGTEPGKEKRELAANAAKIFGVMSTENRISSVAFGFLAAGFATLFATGIAAIVSHYYSFDHHYLHDAAEGGAGSLGVGGLTYVGSSVYKAAKRQELESASRAIQAQIHKAEHPDELRMPHPEERQI